LKSSRPILKSNCIALNTCSELMLRLRAIRIFFELFIFLGIDKTCLNNSKVYSVKLPKLNSSERRKQINRFDK
jgi:hypothetical protein